MPDLRSFALLGSAQLALWIGCLWVADGLPVAENAPRPEAQASGHEGPDFSDPRSFDRWVRPLLSETCFQCHGPDSAARKAKFRVDREADVHGALAELEQRLSSPDPEERMPPAESVRQLSADQRQLLLDWLAAGAPWGEHWSLVAPERPALPELISGADARNPIDAFVLERLSRQGLDPAPRAAPEAQLRRAFLVVTGLPPSPEEQQSFQGEADQLGVDAALDLWIERLTSQEPWLSRYAEQRTRAWLDQARYADTAGIHMDAGWQAWAFRDWVLDAYRENLPFDRFATEQLAGDLLPNADQDSRVASGFHRLHVTTDEGGAIDEEYLVEYAVDRVATTGSVFLGLTLGCARCHDHKYDPVSMEDFYGLFAFFDSVEQPGLYSQQPDPNRAFEPFLVLESPQSEAQLAEIQTRRAELEAKLLVFDPEEAAGWSEFQAEMASAIDWQAEHFLGGTSAGGASLELQADGSVLLSGTRPAHDVLTLEFQLDGDALDSLLLEALPADGLAGQAGIGRADNGNAVLRHLKVEAFSILDPNQRQEVPLSWIAADHEQQNGDFAALNALEDQDSWWALEGHQLPGRRFALVRFEQPVGFPGGTRFVVTLDQRSRWAQHGFARPRISFGRSVEGLDQRLPLALGRIQRSSGFPLQGGIEPYEHLYPPEHEADLRRDTELPGEAEGATWSWSFNEGDLDGVAVNLPTHGREVLYLARELVAPTARQVTFELGSDDGVVLLLDGNKVYENRVDRGLTAASDKVELEIPKGRHLLLQKVVNTGGAAGFYQGIRPLAPAQPFGLFVLALPERAREGAADGLDLARDLWRRERSPRYVELSDQIAKLDLEQQEFLAQRPKAMVMQERRVPRETFVLTRGDYLHPDKSRPVTRRVPAVLGHLPEGAPQDRLGLALWMFSDQNPLTARVIANRLWAELFGRGLVTTDDDFGSQGARPSHPELLDWLAVEFVDSGWNFRHLLRLMLESAAFRRSSAWTEALLEQDPENRLLARYPRQRLTAEELRDSALFGSGLLVERFGGPSVKPYQPEGLWKEVAMLQSNTRNYMRGSGEDLWRRSLYTYWKRAAPPPAMLTLDAPTREFCVTQRSTTDTPLQALVLMNDEQFLEAARKLAERTLLELDAGYAPDPEMPTELVRRGIEHLFRRVLARGPEPRETAAVEAALAEFRARFRAAPEKVSALLAAGEAPREMRLDGAELAAWTFAASSLQNLFEATNPR